MGGLVLVALLSLGDVRADVSAETRAGESPIQPGAAPRAFVAGLITPLLGFRLMDGALELRLEYGARILRQEPNPGDRQAPLILQTASAFLSARPSSRVTTVARASANAGEVDYATLAQVLGPRQASLPSSVTIFAGSARGEVRGALTRLLELDLGAEVDRSQPLGDTASAAPGAAFVMPTMTQAIVDAGLTAEATRRDDVTAAVRGAYATYTNGVTIGSIAPRLGWRLRLTPDRDLRLAAGATYGRDLGSVSGLGGGGRLSPLATASWDERLLLRDEIGVHATVTAGVDYFVDPILSLAGPRASLTASLAVRVAPDWRLGADGSFATNFVNPPMGATLDETVAFASLSSRHRLSPNLSAEIGTRWADRGPTLSTSALGFHQRQIWIYLRLSGTTREAPGAWALP